MAPTTRSKNAATSTARTLGTSDSPMKSDWRSGDPSEWDHYQRSIVRRRLYWAELDKELPVHPKSDKIPHLPEWQCHRWVLYHAAIPMLLHQAFVSLTGYVVPMAAVWLFYSISIGAIGHHQLVVMRHMGEAYGYLDGSKPRDDVPDKQAAKVTWSLVFTVTFRPAMMALLTYRGQAPKEIDWLITPLEVFLYPIILDFWFYWYHRLMHEFDGLWRFHRTHHLTKHPTAMLTLYADAEQEVFDIIGIPLLAYISMKLLGFPMGYYDWWICQMYIIWTELIGHSGMRVHLGNVTSNWFFRYFNCDLVIEDHDLHHRTGWKKSHNYGKQTRLWDRLFGTCNERFESKADNVDYDNPACWPLY